MKNGNGKKSSRRLTSFPYYGGKNKHLSWLLPLLPSSNHFVEPFSGSAAVLLNREPSPLETINDLNQEIVTFFRVLRTRCDELVEALLCTPYSRMEFGNAVRHAPYVSDELEIARLFFIKIRQSRGAQPNPPHENQWAANVNKGGRARAWDNSIQNLHAIRDRLRSVQIEHGSAVEVIERCDSPSTLFYVDPPYPHESRSQGSCDVYFSEMNEEEHYALADLLGSVEGKVAVSGYDCDLMSNLYYRWFKTEAKKRSVASMTHRGNTGRAKRECLWTNYDPKEVNS